MLLRTSFQDCFEKNQLYNTAPCLS